MTTLIKMVQREEFESEINQIKMNKIKSKNRLLSLFPFLDDKGVLRVGGRLQNSNLAFDQKHPAILPATHQLTALIIDEAHRITMHGGKALTLAHIRQKIWIIKGTRAVKQQLQKCVKCTKLKMKMAQQLMGNLPIARTTIARPFTSSGVDYAGPVDLRISRGRGTKTYKGYIVIFVCLSTKAVHLEVASDLTAQAFIAAYKRFTGRRGHIKHLYSDNGTNFVSANKILKHNKELQAAEYNNEIYNELTKLEVEWHFQPPYSPHMGGLWEAGVKSIKYHLKRTLADTKLTFEEFTTVLIQIEACLNSRPLCNMTDDPEDLEVLTPGHFLIGNALLAPPETTDQVTSTPHLSRWKLLERLHHEFWRKWSTQYLSRLQQRPKWVAPKPNIEVGDLVVIRDELLPPTRWALGRIVQTHPGKDNLVRVVSIRTGNNTIKRPVAKICKLPMEHNNKEDRNPNSKVSTFYCNVDVNHKKCHNKVQLNQSFPIVVLVVLLMLIAGPTLNKVNGTNYSSKPQFKITPFIHEPGLYFEHLGELRLSNHDWKIVTYLNLSNYQAELNSYRKCMTRFEKLCEQMNSTGELCLTIYAQFQHVWLEILHKDELIRHTNRKKPRNKRAILNIVGNLASDLFGVMDDRDAKHYEEKINELAENQMALTLLLKNQTSLTDATLNIVKRQEEDISQHWIAFKQQVESILESGQDKAELAALAVHTTLLMLNFQHVQTTLLRAILDSHDSVVSTTILDPHQLYAEIQKMRHSLPRNWDIPYSEQSELIHIYQLMTAKTRVTDNYILFEVKVPLIASEAFQVFHLIPLPITRKNETYEVQNSMDYIASSLHRDLYYVLQAAEFQLCSHIGNSHHICKQHKPIYHWHKGEETCELNLLLSKNDDTCPLRRTKEDKWVQLKTNQWLYALTRRDTLNIVCNHEQHTEVLSGSGIISLEENCIIKTDRITLHGHRSLQGHLESSLLPKVNISYNGIMQHTNINISSILTQDDDIRRLQQATKNLQNAEMKLPTVSYHDYHQYTVSYGTLGCLIIFVIITYIWMRRRTATSTTITQQEGKQRTLKPKDFEINIAEE